MTEAFRVGVIDYEMGNLHSAAKALSLHGADVFVSANASALGDADLLVLPGVGAFGAGMVNLGRVGLDDFVRRWILEEKRPFLGICIGLQLLFESSEEATEPGLGVLKGRVTRFRPEDFKGHDYRVPHMGWNTLDVRVPGEGFYKGIDASERVYFVHTYFPEPADDAIVATTTDYGRSFCSSVSTGRLFATQFHPEKSGDVGRRLLGNVLDREKAGRPMMIIPAIDLRGGKCVRLLQGKAEEQTTYSGDPVEIAKKWVSLGAKRLHVVDLDGAFEGKQHNLEIAARIRRDADIEVEMGGGIRTVETAAAVIAAGIDRVILGTVLVEEAGLAKEMFDRFGARVMVGLDCKDGIVATRGWKGDSGFPVEDALAIVQKLGGKEIIYTDISRDGALQGPNLEAITSVMGKTSLTVIASGGVTTLDDVKALKSIGSPACIVGKALYENRIDLAEAIRIAG